MVDLTEIPFWVKVIAALAGSFAADWCWAYYFINISEKKALKAGLWGVLIILLGAVLTISYVDDIRLLIPTVMGAFIGTVLSVHLSKNKE